MIDIDLIRRILENGDIAVVGGQVVIESRTCRELPISIADQVANMLADNLGDIESTVREFNRWHTPSIDYQ